MTKSADQEGGESAKPRGGSDDDATPVDQVPSSGTWFSTSPATAGDAKGSMASGGGDRGGGDRGGRPRRRNQESSRDGRSGRPTGGRPTGGRPTESRPPRGRLADHMRGASGPRRGEPAAYDERPPRGEAFDADRPRRRDGAPPRQAPPAEKELRGAALRLAEVDELEVTVEKLISGGDGIARFEGIPIFIPRAAPGDLLRVRISERKPSFGRAEIIDILRPGPGRREAPCVHYERCGGCQLQHLEEAQQLRYKAQAARDNLERLGGIEMPSKVHVVAGDPWGYRMRAQWQLGDTPQGRRVGYFARGSHDLVPVDRCPVLAPELQDHLTEVQAMAPQIPHRRLDVCVGDGGAWAVAPSVASLPREAIRLQVGDFTYSFDAGCFFQAHRRLVTDLVAQAMGEPELADAEGDAYDLYSGVGLFSLPLARRYRRVVAIEGGREASRYGRRNAQLNKMSNIENVNQAVDSWISKLPAQAARVLVDPPRVGLTALIRRALLDQRPRHLTYVSCDSATLARDLKVLKAAYRIVSLSLLDMFPQTGHLEAVVQLESNDIVGR